SLRWRSTPRWPTWSTAMARKRWPSSAQACPSARAPASSRSAPPKADVSARRPHLFEPCALRLALLVIAAARKIEMARDLGLALDIERAQLGNRLGLVDIRPLAERAELGPGQQHPARRLPDVHQFVHEPALLFDRSLGE